MQIKSIVLDNSHYREYLKGKEVEVDANVISDRNIMPGEHIMVYKDTIASLTDVSLPKREKQSEYIGVEGTVTRLNAIRDRDQSETLLSLNLKKI